MVVSKVLSNFERGSPPLCQIRARLWRNIINAWSHVVISCVTYILCCRYFNLPSPLSHSRRSCVIPRLPWTIKLPSTMSCGTKTRESGLIMIRGINNPEMPSIPRICRRCTQWATIGIRAPIMPWRLFLTSKEIGSICTLVSFDLRWCL